MDQPKPLPLKRRVEIAVRLTERARGYYDIYLVFEGRETRPYILDILNEHIWFFLLQPHVNRFALLVEVATLYKRKKHQVNLPGLLDEAKNLLPHTRWIELSDLLTKQSETAGKVILIRDNALAHRSATIDFNDAFERAGLTLAQVAELIDTSDQILQPICSAVKIKPPVFTTDEIERSAKQLFKRLGAEFPDDEDPFERMLSGR